MAAAPAAARVRVQAARRVNRQNFAVRRVQPINPFRIPPRNLPRQPDGRRFRPAPSQSPPPECRPAAPRRRPAIPAAPLLRPRTGAPRPRRKPRRPSSPPPAISPPAISASPPLLPGPAAARTRRPRSPASICAATRAVSAPARRITSREGTRRNISASKARIPETKCSVKAIAGYNADGQLFPKPNYDTQPAGIVHRRNAAGRPAKNGARARKHPAGEIGGQQPRRAR